MRIIFRVLPLFLAAVLLAGTLAARRMLPPFPGRSSPPTGPVFPGPADPHPA